MRAYLFFHPCTASCVHTCARIFYARGERERERASSKIGPTATACSLHVKRIQWTVNCALILIAAFIRLVITKATRVLPCFTLSRYILFAHDCSRCVKSRFISPRIPRIEVASLPFKTLLLFSEISLNVRSVSFSPFRHYNYFSFFISDHIVLCSILFMRLSFMRFIIVYPFTVYFASRQPLHGVLNRILFLCT